MLIEKYKSDWIVDFENVKREIEGALSGLNCRIEHVGSTSIPNLDAKSIIDIDIIYENESDFDRIRLGLISLGYYHNGNQGIADREVFKRMGAVSNGILDSVTHHLYVCPIWSAALERHLLMRNYLRNNDWARMKYQEMKYELVERANQDKKVYAQLKEWYVNDFIDEVIRREKELQHKAS